LLTATKIEHLEAQQSLTGNLVRHSIALDLVYF